MTDTAKFSGTPLVLVIDSDPTQRQMARECLEAEGIDVVEAGNAVDGIARALQLSPDIILLDMNMPGMNGFEMCQAIRNNDALRYTPVIMATAREDTEAIARGFAVGATDFIMRPVPKTLLPFRVRFMLRANALESSLRDAKQAAEAASAAKSAFLANMSHELRTPLNAIIGFSEIIENESYGPCSVPQYTDYAKDIRSSGQHLLLIINEILDIAKCEAGQMSLALAQVDLPSIVAACVRQLRTAAEDGRVTLVNRAPDGPVPVLGDALRLSQVILNLLSNAVKFTPEDGAVEIETLAGSGGGASVTVRDTGIGIAPADLARITEPFQQVESALDRKFSGTGLGLPLAIAMARLHGGDIDFESTLGRGTTVRFTLPPASQPVAAETGNVAVAAQS